MEFDTETATLKASFIMDSSIDAPTVIFQSKEHYCGKKGCTCIYLQGGHELGDKQFTTVTNGDLTEFKVITPNYDGDTIEIKC